MNCDMTRVLAGRAQLTKLVDSTCPFMSSAVMDKQSLPPYVRPNERKSRLKGRFGSLAVLLTIFASFQFLISTTTFSTNSAHIPVRAEQVLDRCRALYIEPGPSPRFHSRSVSDRFVPGTKATLLRNARIWTGGENGTEVVTGDIYLNKGIIQGIGSFDNLEDAFPPVELEIIDVKGAWVTPGYENSHQLISAFSSHSCCL